MKQNDVVTPLLTIEVSDDEGAVALFAAFPSDDGNIDIVAGFPSRRVLASLGAVFADIATLIAKDDFVTVTKSETPDVESSESEDGGVDGIPF